MDNVVAGSSVLLKILITNIIGIAVIIGLIIFLASTQKKKEDFTSRPKLVLHYTNWCGFCKQFKPHWERLKMDIVKDPLGSKIAVLEVDEDKARTRGISAYPTIMLYKGHHSYEYKGMRDIAMIKQWAIRLSNQ